MPLTFIDIERQKNWRIWIFFLVLMLIYLCMTLFFGALFFPVPWHAAARFWIFAGVMAAVVASIHFWFSASDAVRDAVRELDARPPDGQDEIHRVLINIMEEMHVATGNRRRIQCAVVPSLSLNALAVSDLKGNAAIGITEGLLSRLSRPQLESVIAHEAHHILSGDCLEASVATSIFGTYAAAIEKVSNTSRGRTFSSPAFLLAWALLQLSYLLNLFISREREYRADAASVRMTRNPVALAETLHLLSRGWRGAGFIGSGFEMLCIVNPKAMALDESEGFLADLLSTHPPIRKRIEILLKMARVSITELDAKAERKTSRMRKESGPIYFAMSPRHEWQGPFTAMELASLPWLSPLTWVTTGDQAPLDRAWKQPLLNTIFMDRLSAKGNLLSEHTCPACNQPLVIGSYEGTRVFLCSFCAGTLVENDKIPRIIARTGRSMPCSERINTLARNEVNNNARSAVRLHGRRRPGVPLLACPKCRNSMQRGFYSSAHLIEVDRCSFCNMTWFEQDELAMLQCLIENRIMPGVDFNSDSRTATAKL
jgi:heat shock protein HtpX